MGLPSLTMPTKNLNLNNMEAILSQDVDIPEVGARQYGQTGDQARVVDTEN